MARVVIYVRSTGNDSTGNGATPATAFRTVQHALGTIPLSGSSNYYVVDITGLNDTNQNIIVPPFVSNAGLVATPSPPNPMIADEGYVSIEATPTVLVSLNAPTTTLSFDPITGLCTITDTSQSWTANQWRGKFVSGTGVFEGGVIVSNTATQLVTTATAMSVPVAINDVGATLTGPSGTYAPTIQIGGVKAAFVISGVSIQSVGSGRPAIVGSQGVDSLLLQMVSTNQPNITGPGALVSAFWSYFLGAGGGNWIDMVIDGSVNLTNAYLRQLTPAFNGKVVVNGCYVDNCRFLDTDGALAPSLIVEYSRFDGQGLVVMSGSAQLLNVVSGNAVSVAHINPNGSGIVVEGGASVNLNEGNIGGSGNAGYGLEVNSGATVWMEVGETVVASVTGALGDMKIGKRPVRSWSDFGANPPLNTEVDPYTLSSFTINNSPDYSPLFPALSTLPAANTVAADVIMRDTSKNLLAMSNGSSWVYIDDPNAVFALSLPGGAAQTHVNCSVFWAGGTVLANSMYWRMWIKKNDANGGYVISDSYGGAHALLLDVDGQGNIYFSPGGLLSFGSDDAMPVGQWYELSIAITVDTAGTPYILVRMNGIPVGATAIPAGNTRAAPNAAQGSPNSVLYIGGSTHINANFQIAKIEAFDLQNPFTNFTPQFPQRFYGAYPGLSSPIQPDFLMDFTERCLIVPDLSWGYAGGVTPTLTNRVKHHGQLENSSNGLGVAPMAYPMPKWVPANDGPWSHDAVPVAPGGRSLTPRTPPPGAKIFDSFQRQDQNFAYFNNPSLGSTEAGSLGALTYSYGVPSSVSSNLPAGTQWGLLDGNAVFLDQVAGLAWVLNSSADMDASIANRVGNWGNGATGLAFRVQDANNFWYAVYWGTSVGGWQVFLGYVSGGTFVAVGNAAVAKGQHVIEAVTAGTSITIKVDGTTKITTTSSLFQTAKGVGPFCPSVSAGGNNDWGLARWSNFTVL